MIKLYSKFVCISIFLIVFVTRMNTAQTAVNQTVNKSIPQDKLTDHPRLFFPKGQEAEILKKAEKNPLLAELIGTLRNKDMEKHRDGFKGQERELCDDR